MTVREGAAPICLSIAGSDSSGGAGIQADLKTFAALGVYGASAITAITAQNTRSVVAVHEVPPRMIAGQIRAVLDDLAVGAIKIGMLLSPGVVEAVARQLEGIRCPVVLDPVMVAKSGASLLQEAALTALREMLLPKATLLTPNLPEAARLLNREPAGSGKEAESQGRALLQLGPSAVLIKGGHAHGPQCVDVLVQPQLDAIYMTAPRVDTPHTHGTGCTLSSAIAAGLAKGLALEQACVEAHTYLQGAIRAAAQLRVGSGRGPVHHFHGHWT